ncbi:MAG: ATP-grasp family protein [Nitrospinae bacterium CG22_combo_CG10-13_8_21_14_all_47_10]|nr:MAG: ATP-grasp family protein [Nitrospinae bacterium CG22_combo_CG10-13_8_21_14_all_47_10]
MAKIGIIGIPGSWSSEHLADIVESKTGNRYLIDMAEVAYNLEKNYIGKGSLDLGSFDAFIIKKIGAQYSPSLINRLEILESLSRSGVKIYSSPKSILGLLDRMTCTLKLKQGDIPLPSTVLTESIDEACQAVQEFGKAVLKPLYTSKARGMKVLEASNGIRLELESYKAEGNSMIYIQKMVSIPGKDLGIVFLGGEYLATYARVAQTDSWNTTTQFGGTYEPYNPSQEIIDLAHRAQSLFDLDFTCVDLVETQEGPKIFEVSAFGGFRGLKEACDIDAAPLLVDHALKKMKNE